MELLLFDPHSKSCTNLSFPNKINDFGIKRNISVENSFDYLFLGAATHKDENFAVEDTTAHVLI